MAKKQWDDLSPAARKAIIVGGVFDTSLKVAALVDLARRPADQVKGSKRVWAVALTVVNSVGLLPLYYFRKGRVTAD